ncbi:MAG TPA: hypothetical protein VG326_01125 [Tepidisphaeraceae bacterium]|jgi:hypothetical protein|nr:hypothetical protein [Tepidisphaeraceae bacterium]
MKSFFIVKEDEDGGYFARAMGYSIFSQDDSRNELAEMVRDAVRCYFDTEGAAPNLIHLHYVHDEVIAL